MLSPSHQSLQYYEEHVHNGLHKELLGQTNGKVTLNKIKYHCYLDSINLILMS
uniref:Uncharacterized protein n=1 Tax=Arundo donax TaxID=35708 RepID=A0A0A9CQ94_ARUDO